MRRKNASQKSACLVSIAAFCLFTATPAIAQVVNSGTVDKSLECVGVVVAGVNSGDILNVREGPGVTYEILTTLEPAEEALATGLTEQVGNSVWYQIATTGCEPVGWVNSRFLQVVPNTTVGPATTDVPATSATPTTLAPVGDLGNDGESNIELSLFTTGLLGLGVFGLLAGVIMAVRGRSRERARQGPPPGMVGPPGGPYLLAPVRRSEKDPKVIQIGGTPNPVSGRRGTDLAEDLIDPVSAFPDVPDQLPDDRSSAPSPEPESKKTTRPTMRLFGTTSLAAGNATEEDQGS